jgi:predicted phage terminase large subunit-like protein
MTRQVIRPQAGPQERFSSTSADIAVFGGSAGGGKTWSLLLEPLRHIGNPRFGAVLFRRTTPQIRNQGGLWDASGELYRLVGGKPKETTLEWRFPSGAKVKLSHLELERNKHDWQGSEVPLLCWDELTHFTASQFFYVSLSRGRSTCGVRPYVRATCNPDATSWVKEFLAPWVDSRFPEPAASGEVRWFQREEGLIRWVPAGTPEALSVTFVRASVFDNRILLEADPGYIAKLKAMPLVDRRRLLEGDWEIVEGGNMFRREWFEIVPEAPSDLVALCRFWDLASTKPRPGRSDPDWTVGFLMGMRRDRSLWGLDLQRIRDVPAQVDKLIEQTTALDVARYGKAVRFRVEEEGGSSGKRTVDQLAREIFKGLDFRGVRSTGDKADRARPLSRMAEDGRVKLVTGAWIGDFLNSAAAFPNPEVHDDDVDAFSGAGAVLMNLPAPPVARSVGRG